MTILQALILGIVQGLTEFIPISSSAHLVLARWLFNWPRGPEAFAFDVLVQVGTLVAVIVYFWRDLWGMAGHMLAGLAARRPLGTPEARLGWWVVVATIPAVVLGLLFKDFFEATFGDAAWTAAQLVLNGLMLVAAERLTRGRQTRPLESLNVVDAAVIGLAQAVAILPGISRSGATISGALARRLERRSAARFSFLMSVPVMLGAGVIAAKDLLDLPNFNAYLLPIGLGFLAAAVVGYLSIRWLLGYLSRHSMEAFGTYCVVAGGLCLIFALLR
jgi:undecaprenyl-diphosphatase